MANYILDMIVNEGSFTHKLADSDKPVWVMFKVDGTNTSIATPKVQFSANPVWNYKIRLTPQVTALENAYMYVNLCTLSNHSDQVISVAVSKVGLKNLPVGNPRTFKFPLMSTTNTAIQVGHLKLTATISAFVMKPTYNSGAPGMGMGMAPMGYPSQPRSPYNSGGFTPPSYPGAYQSYPH